MHSKSHHTITHAVVLAAGSGTRMRPLTEFVPKPMVRICGKNAIEHMLDVLPSTVTDVVLVVGYLQHQIRNHFGSSFGGRHIHYVEQTERRGTGHALFACKELLAQCERFLVCMGDDIHSARDITALCAAGDNAFLVRSAAYAFSGGAVITDIEQRLVDIVEGQHMPPVRMNAAVYVLTPAIFTYPLVAIKDGAEYGLPQTLVSMSKDTPVHIVEAEDWVQVTELADIPKAEAELQKMGRYAM
jgi:UDP-N-acetylglucosamine diphosphorylase / glucose-1-phosphate thymidylyltransferase / UDP-N-acetylgalactosamine diphosphorylase / glucosamine-1-phosphate N-acetyltransferase / galactosamine-1-phosphate N-acetyltransferase